MGSSDLVWHWGKLAIVSLVHGWKLAPKLEIYQGILVQNLQKWIFIKYIENLWKFKILRCPSWNVILDAISSFLYFIRDWGLQNSIWFFICTVLDGQGNVRLVHPRGRYGVPCLNNFALFIYIYIFKCIQIF